MPGFMQFLAEMLNDGEKYEKLPRFIPYLALPIGMALLTFRYLQLAWAIWTGKTDTLISSHEVEEALEEMTKQSQPAEGK